MARKSRKTGTEIPAPINNVKTYNTALYVRLSIEDSGKEDGDSLYNQQLLLEQYVADRPEFALKRVFTDNGETGTDFLRPAWNNLIADCKSGKIDCLVVKDLSRVGRNYIETGEYLEKIFPLLGVRVIAVNDGYDNLDITNNEQFIANVKNLVNDIYVKDLRRKVQAAKKSQKLNGDFLGAFAPYGYVRLLEKKKRIVIDQETAPIVRQIFKWKAEGRGNIQIVQSLDGAGIPCPSKYRYMKGIIKSERYCNSRWTYNAVRDILNNQAYLGHTVQNKYTTLEWKRNANNMDKDVSFVIENTHEPIVTAELFNAAHAVMDSALAKHNESKGKYGYFKKPENKLAGLVFCADCGKPLVRKKVVTGKGKYCNWVYHCPTSEMLNDCSKKYIYTADLEETVVAAIRAEVQKCADISAIIEKLNRTSVHKSRLAAFDAENEEAKRELKRIVSLRQAAYEDYAEKMLTASEYQYAIEKYDKETDRLKTRISDVERSKKEYELRSTSMNKWITAFTGFSEVKELSADMAQALIERIKISNRSCVTIIFKFRDEYIELRDSCGIDESI